MRASSDLRLSDDCSLTLATESLHLLRNRFISMSQSHTDASSEDRNVWQDESDQTGDDDMDYEVSLWSILLTDGCNSETRSATAASADEK